MNRDKFWLIRTYQNHVETSAKVIAQKDASEEEIASLLEAIKKTSMTDEEIISSPLRFKIFRDHMEGGKMILTSGMNPHATAILCLRNELPKYLQQQVVQL